MQISLISNAFGIACIPFSDIIAYKKKTFKRYRLIKLPTSSATIHKLPFGLKSFAKPDMASQNRRKKLRRYIQLIANRRDFLRRFREAMSGFAKLLSLKGKLWIVALLLLHYCLKIKLPQAMVIVPKIFHPGSTGLRIQKWLRWTMH